MRPEASFFQRVIGAHGCAPLHKKPGSADFCDTLRNPWEPLAFSWRANPQRSEYLSQRSIPDDFMSLPSYQLELLRETGLGVIEILHHKTCFAAFGGINV